MLYKPQKKQQPAEQNSPQQEQSSIPQSELIEFQANELQSRVLGLSLNEASQNTRSNQNNKISSDQFQDKRFQKMSIQEKERRIDLARNKIQTNDANQIFQPNKNCRYCCFLIQRNLSTICQGCLLVNHYGSLLTYKNLIDYGQIGEKLPGLTKELQKKAKERFQNREKGIVVNFDGLAPAGNQPRQKCQIKPQLQFKQEKQWPDLCQQNRENVKKNSSVLNQYHQQYQQQEGLGIIQTEQWMSPYSKQDQWNKEDGAIQHGRQYATRNRGNAPQSEKKNITKQNNQKQGNDEGKKKGINVISMNDKDKRKDQQQKEKDQYICHCKKVGCTDFQCGCRRQNKKCTSSCQCVMGCCKNRTSQGQQHQEQNPLRNPRQLFSLEVGNTNQPQNIIIECEEYHFEVGDFGEKQEKQISTNQQGSEEKQQHTIILPQQAHQPTVIQQVIIAPSQQLTQPQIIPASPIQAQTQKSPKTIPNTQSSLTSQSNLMVHLTREYLESLVYMEYPIDSEENQMVTMLKGCENAGQMNVRELGGGDGVELSENQIGIEIKERRSSC